MIYSSKDFIGYIQNHPLFIKLSETEKKFILVVFYENECLLKRCVCILSMLCVNDYYNNETLKNIWYQCLALGCNLLNMDRLRMDTCLCNNGWLKKMSHKLLIISIDFCRSQIKNNTKE